MLPPWLPLLLLAQAAAPPAPKPAFWETKPPAEWSDEEIDSLMTSSPWATISNWKTIPGFLASAKPIREAEEILYQRRSLQAEVRQDEEDYHTYITQNPGKHLVVAVQVPVTDAYRDPRERKTIEKECFLRVGKGKVKAIGHFPPTPADPYLRIVFPKVPLETVKVLKIGVYLPGLAKPLQDFELPVKDLMYRGRLEY